MTSGSMKCNGRVVSTMRRLSADSQCRYANRQALKKEQAMRGTQAGKLRDIMYVISHDVVGPTWLTLSGNL